MIQTPATVEYCHDIVLEASKKDILEELISFLKELKARHSFEFLWRARCLKQNDIPILRIWTLHTSRGDAETDLFHLKYQLVGQDTSMIIVARVGDEFELGTSRHLDMGPFIGL